MDLKTALHSGVHTASFHTTCMVLMVGMPAGAATPVVVPGVDVGVNPGCPAGSAGGGASREHL